MSLQPDALNAQFSHMTLAPQPPNDSGPPAPDGRHYPSVYHHHHHSSPMMLQGAPPQQVASYVVAGPSGGLLQGQHVPLPNPGSSHTYPSSTQGPAAAAAYPGMNQPLLQQHTYVQQPVQQVGLHSLVTSAALWLIPIFSPDINVWMFHSGVMCLLQMSTCYCSSAHHPHCSSQQQPQQPQSHYRPPVSALPYNCPQSQNLPQQQGTNIFLLILLQSSRSLFWG